MGTFTWPPVGILNWPLTFFVSQRGGDFQAPAGEDFQTLFGHSAAIDQLYRDKPDLRGTPSKRLFRSGARELMKDWLPWRSRKQNE